MPVDTQQIMESADKVGQLVAQHPAVQKYKAAQKSLAEDPEASKLVAEFNRQLISLSRQQEQGYQVSDAQRHALESMQMQIQSHLKVKAMNLAEVEFVDLMRKVSDAIRSKLSDQPAAGAAGAGAAAAPKIVM